MGKTGSHARRSRDCSEDPAGDGFRMVRLQALIREEVNQLLRNEIRDARLAGVIATQVELSRDGSRARVWFTADTEEDRSEALEGATGFLRSQLAASLGLKRTPMVVFRRDPAAREWPSSEENF